MTSRPTARIALAASLAALSCDGALLELGSRDGGARDGPGDVSSVPEATPPPQPTCPSITDQENEQLRGATCLGACSDGLVPGRDLSSPAMMAAGLTATWTFCSGALGPAGTTGARVLSNCGVIFEPVTDSDAGIATYDVVTTDGGVATGIVLHLATGDLYATVSASACLGRAELSFDGGVVELSSLSPPGAATAK